MPKLVDGTFNAIIEQSVIKYINRSWKIENIVANTVDAMHDTALFVGNNNYNVFVKAGTNSFSLDQFIQEAWGLEYIRKHSAIKTPYIIDIVKTDFAVLLIMEAIDVKPVQTKEEWGILGSGLATLHKSTWDKCGLETHSYLGIFRQNNSPMSTWAEFFGKRRLGDSLQMAIDSHNITSKEINAVEKLINKLPDICDPAQPFSLLHGDPWIGNLLFDGKQLVLIDCSIYYGNREIDLSTVDFFYEVPNYFFDAYNECYPIAPGYDERKDLWRINQWLGHVCLFGKSYLPKLMDAVNKYL